MNVRIFRQTQLSVVCIPIRLSYLATSFGK